MRNAYQNRAGSTRSFRPEPILLDLCPGAVVLIEAPGGSIQVSVREDGTIETSDPACGVVPTGARVRLEKRAVRP